MSGFRWAYDPEICDGKPCPNDCDSCGLKDLIDEKWEEGTINNENNQ